MEAYNEKPATFINQDWPVTFNPWQQSNVSAEEWRLNRQKIACR